MRDSEIGIAYECRPTPGMNIYKMIIYRCSQTGQAQKPLLCAAIQAMSKMTRRRASLLGFRLSSDRMAGIKHIAFVNIAPKRSTCSIR